MVELLQALAWAIKVDDAPEQALGEQRDAEFHSCL